MKNEELRKILKDWDAHVAPDETMTKEIKQNIMKNLDRRRIFEFPRSDYFYIPKKVAYIAGIAASVCIAFLTGMHFNKSSHSKSQFSGCPPEQIVSLSQDEIRNLKKISSEIDLVFPEGVRMISQFNNDDIQIDTDPKRSIGTANDKVLIRYIVLKKELGQKHWSKIHVANVIANAGEPLELKGKDSGYVWIYPADKDVYAVQSQLKIHVDGQTIYSNYSGGQELRTPQRIKTIQENNTEYRIYQEIVKI